MEQLPKTRVYVSSTYVDLVEHRAKLVQALRTAGYDVESMETYAASDARPADKCVADVAACDVYVGIIARRYGYIPADANPAQHAITEMEYREASRVGRQRFIFLLDPKAPWPDEHDDARTGAGEQGARIRQFRDELGKEHIAAFFKTPEELTLQVLQALSHVPKPEGRPHWLLRGFWRAARVVALVGGVTLAVEAFFDSAMHEWSTNQPDAAQAIALIWGLLTTLGIEAVLWARRRRASRASS
ncbi:MAG: DUF4062 domain-containing protein [Leptothrix sp. (in: b-proteobacteria)]